jgi:hypothetical protein
MSFGELLGGAQPESSVVGGAHDNHDEPTGSQLSSVQTGVCVCEHTPSSPSTQSLLPLRTASHRKELKVVHQGIDCFLPFLVQTPFSLSSFAALPRPLILYFYIFIFVFHFNAILKSRVAGNTAPCFSALLS